MFGLTEKFNADSWLYTVIERAQPHDAQPRVMAKIHELRSHVESIKSFSILLWQTKGITAGFFLGVMANIEEIGKQVACWEKYLVKFLPKN